ncbi:MAG TPA: HPr family phosphocarrier protein [Candidatus Contendobacter sp.]|nr:HPr family phosphocarrier protein [Candidatus Contendobacter sp.]
MTLAADSNLPQLNKWAAINHGEFTDLIAQRAHKLLALAHHLSAYRLDTLILTRPLMADLLSQSAQIEELLDAYGARNNQQWSRIRSLTATMKLFADVGYELLHIKHSLPLYRLLPIQRDFAADTTRSLDLTHDVLARAAGWILTQAARLDLPLSTTPLNPQDYAEPLPPGRLPGDRPVRRVKSTSETVTHLATAYLNLAADSELLNIAGRTEPADYACCFPKPVSEDSLRYLNFRFHSLQALYDTHVSETEIEYLDADLPILRGHISVIYHLLEIATQLVHYYERHLNIRTGDSSLRRKPVIAPETLLDMLMSYSITYAGLYLNLGRRLCHAMLKRYAEVGTIKAPVPSYRGFHVRPATLVAKIVQHYGSDVHMELGSQSYDASSPLDLFRANEKINAQKRRWLVTEIERLVRPDGDLSDSQIRTTVLDVLLKLAEQGKLVIYQQPLQLSEEFSQEGILLEKVTAEIARLQATGQIDIKTDLSIAFTGDKRVLSDLKLLAKSGYGEDCFGNNIALPKELAYLRR